MAQSITLQTSDNDIIASDVLGRLSFAASSESSGSDAILIGASIYAMAESDFTAISNATSIIFATSSSESAAAKLKISSQGHFLPILNKTYDIGASGTKFRNVYAENGKFENISISNLSDPYEILYITDADGNVSSTNFLKVDVANSGLDLNGDIVGTGNINISGNLTANSGNLDVISFNVNDESPLLKGQLSWDDTEGTLSLGLTDNSTIHFGEHRYFRIRNQTGGVLYKGQVVYASGVHSNGLISPNKYVADGSIREVRFMGVVLENVNDNNNGYVVDFGHLHDMDLDGSATNYAVGDETWVAGDILYVHPTQAGKLTKVEPKHSISVAIVLDPGNGNGNGRMFVRPTSYGHLDDNHDVAVSGATNGQFLQYNSATDYWVPSSSGNFSTLQVNGTSVSVSGHSHVSSDITNFNSSVSGLLPTIANSGDNRILTSTGSTVGINAESNLTFNNNTLTIGSTAATTLTINASSSGSDGPVILGKADNANEWLICSQRGLVGNGALGLGLYVYNAYPMSFWTNNLERMRITSDGNVGIGTTSPNGKLDVVGGRTFLAANNEPYGLGVRYISTGGAVYFGATSSSATPDAVISNAGGTELIRFTTGGNVGIGTSSPSFKLDVSGAGRIGNGVSQGSPGSTNIKSTAHTLLSGTGGNYLAFGQYGSGSNYAQWIQSSFDNPSTATYNLVLQPLGGNVGIGTSNPSYKLHLEQSGSASTVLSSFLQPSLTTGNFNQIYIGRTSTSNDCGTITYTTNATAANSFLSLGLYGSSYSLNINGNGNVGIGTTTPGGALEVAGGQLLVTAGSASAPGVAISGDPNTGMFSPSADVLALATAGSERVRVDASGNVGIGLLPNHRLHVGRSSTGIVGRFTDNATQTLDIGITASAGAYLDNPNSGYIDFQIGGASAMRLTGGSELLIGTTTDNGAYKLQVNSQIYATNATIATSDARFKANVESLTDATAVIEALRPVAFDFIPHEERNFATERQVGLIAQEAQSALAGTDYADSVVAQCGDHLGLAYEKLVPVLIRALQESNARIAALEERLNHA